MRFPTLGLARLLPEVSLSCGSTTREDGRLCRTGKVTRVSPGCPGADERDVRAEAAERREGNPRDPARSAGPGVSGAAERTRPGNPQVAAPSPPAHHRPRHAGPRPASV